MNKREVHHLTDRHRRKSNYELLRIFSTLLIIGIHCAQHGMGGDYAVFKNTFSIKWLISFVLGAWGQLGVVLFIMTTCWFACDRVGIKTINYVKIIMQTWIVCLLAIVFNYVLRLNILSGSNVIKELLTPIYDQYWFITNYLIFGMMIPILQFIVKKIQRKKLKWICGLFTIIMPLYNTVLNDYDASIILFIYIFLITSYLKGTDNNCFEKNRKIGWIGLIIIILIACVAKLIDQKIQFRISLFLLVEHNLVGRSLLLIASAICIFYCFKNLSIGYSKIINLLGKSTLGVYIIHENMLFHPLKGYSLLYDQIFQIEKWYNKSSINYFAYYVIMIVIIFIVCMMIDIIICKVIDVVLKKSIIIKQLCNKLDDFSIHVFND